MAYAHGDPPRRPKSGAHVGAVPAHGMVGRQVDDLPPVASFVIVNWHVGINMSYLFAGCRRLRYYTRLDYPILYYTILSYTILYFYYLLLAQNSFERLVIQLCYAFLVWPCGHLWQSLQKMQCHPENLRMERDAAETCHCCTTMMTMIYICLCVCV